METRSRISIGSDVRISKRYSKWGNGEKENNFTSYIKSMAQHCDGTFSRNINFFDIFGETQMFFQKHLLGNRSLEVS